MLGHPNVLEEAGLEPASSALSVLGNPLPPASNKPTRGSAPQVASECIRNPRRLLTCAAASRLTAFQVLRCAPVCATPPLVTCAGLEPATRPFERRFARPLRVARHETRRCVRGHEQPLSIGASCRNRTRMNWLEASCLSHSAKPASYQLRFVVFVSRTQQNRALARKRHIELSFTYAASPLQFQTIRYQPSRQRFRFRTDANY